MSFGVVIFIKYIIRYLNYYSHHNNRQINHFLNYKVISKNKLIFLICFNETLHLKPNQFDDDEMNKEPLEKI